MRAETIQRVVSFVRSIATKCPCYYNNTERCHDCLGCRAKILLMEINADLAETPPPKKDNVYVRRAKILKILREAGRPLLASEIVIDSACSMQLKNFTLKEMCKKGILGKSFAYQKGPNKFFRFYIKGDNNYENNNA